MIANIHSGGRNWQPGEWWPCLSLKQLMEHLWKLIDGISIKIISTQQPTVRVMSYFNTWPTALSLNVNIFFKFISMSNNNINLSICCLAIFVTWKSYHMKILSQKAFYDFLLQIIIKMTITGDLLISDLNISTLWTVIFFCKISSLQFGTYLQKSVQTNSQCVCRRRRAWIKIAADYTLYIRDC